MSHHNHKHHDSGGHHHLHNSRSEGHHGIHTHGDHGHTGGDGTHHAAGDAAHTAKHKLTTEYLDSHHVTGKKASVSRTADHAGHKPAHVDGKPAHVDGKPAHVDGKPAHVDGKPAHVDGKLAHVDGKLAHVDGKVASTEHAGPVEHKASVSRVAEKDDGKAKPADQQPHATALDTKKSVSEQVAAGLFRAADKSEGAKEGDATVRDTTKNPVKTIDVVYQDRSGLKDRPKTEPDFRVKHDGTVEVLHNPDHKPGDKVTIEVERPAGDRSAPPPAQQKAVDDLVGYLANRYMPEKKAPDGSVTRDGQVNDEQGLISERAKKSLHTKPAAEDSLPEAARNQVHNVNRWHGSGGGRHHGDGGRFSSRQVGEQFAGRDVPRQPGEDDKLAAMKDVSSGFFSRGEKDPYHVVRSTPDRGHRVGRYGVSSDQFRHWLSGLSEEEIEKLIKEGKLPAGALDLKNGKNTPAAQEMEGFLNKMKGGKEHLSKAEIDKFMPKTLQERIGTDLTKEYAAATADRDANGRPTRVNVGKVALSFELGRAATEDDAKKPENQRFIKAAEDSYPLALERAMNGGGAVDMTDAGRKITSAAQASLGQVKWGRHAAATENGNLGCAASVSSVLRDAGVANVDELGVTGLAQKLRSQGWHAVPFEQRKPGDVIIALGNAGRHGHTGIVGANVNETFDNHSSSGLWSRDHAGYWKSGRWPVVYVLHAPEA